jgi:quinol-cytochrome oxidoreductase complex cytochrome b subunit
MTETGEKTREVQEYDHKQEWGDSPTIRFVPDHILTEVAAVVMLLALYTVLAIFVGSHLDIKAEPAITPEGSKPEWYFLFLFEFLHYVPPLVGTIVPAIGVVFLVALPWLDRNPSKRPRDRKIALAVMSIIMVGIVVLSIRGWLQ